MRRNQICSILLVSIVTASACQRKQQQQVDVQQRKPTTSPQKPDQQTQSPEPEGIFDPSSPTVPSTIGSTSPIPGVSTTPPVSPIINSTPIPIGVTPPNPTPPSINSPISSTPDSSLPDTGISDNPGTPGTPGAPDTNTPEVPITPDQIPGGNDPSTGTTTDATQAFITVKMSEIDGVTLSFAKDVEKASYRISSKGLSTPISIDAGVAKVPLEPILEVDFSLKESLSKVCKAKISLNSAEVFIKLEAIKCQ